MEETSLISPLIKEYVEKFKLEDKLNEAINEVLRKLPDDPFSAISNILKNNSLSFFVVEKVNLRKVFFGDFKPYLCIEIFMSFKGITRKCFSQNLTFNLKIFDNLTNLLETITYTFEKFYSHLLTQFTIEQSSSLDKALKSVCDDLARTDPNSQLIGKLLSNAVSFGVFASQSVIQEISLKDYVHENMNENIVNEKKIPNIGFCVFKAGKSMNSKVKYERFFLIVNNSSKMKKEELCALVSKIYASIKKLLTSGKQGELGMRLNNEGSYFPPSDTLNDTIKALEDIIKDTGETHKLCIGIDCNANNYYSESTLKYEMDGFKKPPEADELIDYYLKYLNEHPLITYLEDPIADADRLGWKKIYAKFESKHNVTISSKSLVAESSSHFKTLTEVLDIEETSDYMTEEEREKILHDNKTKAEENLKKIPFTSISYRLNECVTLTELFDSVKLLKKNLTEGKKCELTLWDNAVESDQSIVVDMALGLRANLILLHGINNKNERINKINRYIELIEELY